MAVYHCATLLAGSSGLPEDVRQQNWYAEEDGVAANLVSASIFAAAVEDMYTDANSGGSFVMGTIFSDLVSRGVGACSNKVWSINEATGVETFQIEIPFTMPATGGATEYPGEVALRLTLHGELDGSEADRRKRGGPFLGPLHSSVASIDGNNVPRPNSTFVDGIILTFQDMDDQLVANGLISVIWSRTALEAFGIVGGWIDNAFDTQRRRGSSPTSRTTFIT